MNMSQFNFEHAHWLWALCFVPLMFLMRKYFKPFSRQAISNLERFADKHLLPHLIKQTALEKKTFRNNIHLPSVLWMLGVLALAGPRWDFKEVQTFKPQKNLLILLDLSESMDLDDVKPSRLIRAKLKIDDILEENPDLNVGLIGFAADAHLITPITEDRNAIRHMLGAVRTDLIAVQGNYVASALALANQVFGDVTGGDKAVIVMSDGDLDETDVTRDLDQLARQDVKVSVMGFGTFDANLKLDQSRLEKISSNGNGRMYGLNDVPTTQNLFYSRGPTNKTDAAHGVTKDWEQRFYVFLIPMLLLMLPMFRRKIPIQRSTKAAVLLLFALFFSNNVMAAEKPGLKQLFKNSEMLGKEALDNKDYQTAAQRFKDPYRLGVAQYQAGEYDKAEQSFQSSRRPEVSLSAKYNLGNALAQQGKYNQAIQAYQEVLKQQPNHTSAKANLDIVQNLLKKQKQNQNENQKQSPNDKESDEEKKSDQQNKSDQDKKSGEDQKPDEKKSSDGNQTQANKQTDDQEKNKSTAESKWEKSEEEKKSQAEKQFESEQKAKQEKDPKKIEQLANESSATPPGRVNRVKRTPEDIDADQWLNRVSNDPHDFLKNQFLIESARMKTKKGR